jgi:heptosyltransferase I
MGGQKPRYSSPRHHRGVPFPSVPRILFVKTSSLGDVVHHCPAVSDAARRLPGAQIDWVVEEDFAGVAALHPAVRRVIPIALRRWRHSLWRPGAWAELGALRRELGAESYDAVVDSQGLLKSALLCTFARGMRHGYDAQSAREPFAARFYNARYAVSRAQHAVERNRALSAAALGYSLDDQCAYDLRSEGAPPIESGEPYAVLVTMTSREDKLWPEGRWVQLGRALGTRGLRCILPWGSETERARCERLAGAIGDALVPGRLVLDQLARLLRGARGVAGTDTGVTHLAGALGVPTVGIYCGSDPALTGLYGSARIRNLGDAGAPPDTAAVAAALEGLW